MPGRPTKGHVAVNLELPADLVERVRDFARRDMRSIKTEFIRALELLLRTYDNFDSPGLTPSLPTHKSSSDGETLAKSTGSSQAQKPPSLLSRWEDEALGPFFHWMVTKKKRKAPLLFALATHLRQGLTYDEILTRYDRTKQPEVSSTLVMIDQDAEEWSRRMARQGQ
jgi:hypothetical protein